MNRNLTYFLLTFIIFFFSIVVPLFNPDKGIYFIVEETIGLLIIVIGYFLFNKKVKQLVQKLNTNLPWKEQPVQRIKKELALIVGYASALACVLLIVGAIFIHFNGEPAYYAKKEQFKKERNTARIKQIEVLAKNNNFNLYELRDFSIFTLTGPIIGSSFFLFAALFGIEEGFYFNGYRQQQLLRKEQLAKEQALAKANALKKQLNPHFMFNTLNVLGGLMHEDLNKADEFLKKLSEIYRYFLEQNEEVVATLEKELAFIKSYIFLQKIRFEDKIQVNYTIPQNRLNWLLPSMTLELLVENAIKHNAITHENPLQIEINVIGRTLVVKNNYQPRKDIDGVGIGIKHLQEQLKLLGLGAGKFDLHANYFVATIPLLQPEHND